MPKTTYVWDELSDNVIEEYEDGVLSVSYTHEPGLYGNLLSQNRNGVTSYYHYDGRGDTVALTDDSGNITDTKEYDAWGNVTASTGSTVTPYSACAARSVRSQIEPRLLSFHGIYFSPSSGRPLTAYGTGIFNAVLFPKDREKADPQLTVKIEPFPSTNCGQHRIEISPSIESSRQWLESHPTRVSPAPGNPDAIITETDIWGFQYLNIVSVDDGCCNGNQGCVQDGRATRCRKEYYELLGGQSLAFRGCNSTERCFWDMGRGSTDVHLNGWLDQGICIDKGCGSIIVLVQMRFFVEGHTVDRTGTKTGEPFSSWPETSFYDSCSRTLSTGHLSKTKPPWWDRVVPLASAFYRYELDSCCCDQSYRNARVVSIDGPVARKPDWWKE
jgi:YD repeat-containing protein